MKEVYVACKNISFYGDDISKYDAGKILMLKNGINNLTVKSLRIDAIKVI